MDTVVADPAAAVEAARDGATELGMKVRAFSAAEGYLETLWFNPATKQSHHEDSDPRRLVRLRVWTDLVTPRETQVVVETVLRRTMDPSVPDREVEIVADSGSAGDSLTQAVRAHVRKALGAATAPRDSTSGAGAAPARQSAPSRDSTAARDSIPAPARDTTTARPTAPR